MSEALDHWLPDATVRTDHRRAASAAPATRCGRRRRAIRLADTRRLGRLVGWRIPGVQASQTYHELFRAYPFTVLDESEHGLVSGLCGRIWTLARDYPALDGAGGVRGLGRARHGPRRVRALGASRSTTASRAALGGARAAGRRAARGCG